MLIPTYLSDERHTALTEMIHSQEMDDLLNSMQLRADMLSHAAGIETQGIAAEAISSGSAGVSPSTLGAMIEASRLVLAIQTLRAEFEQRPITELMYDNTRN